jgi:magnesium-transporting ATPase (P-type)
VLAEGDAVSADARLVEGASLTVAEAALTGESEAVLKDVATLAGHRPPSAIGSTWSSAAPRSPAAGGGRS